MAMVRPYLEYENVIWHPQIKVDKAEIEKVQKDSHKTNPNHMKHDFGP